MTDTTINFRDATANGIPEDIVALTRLFALPKINYINFSQREHLTQILERWPLLTELSQLTTSD